MRKLLLIALLLLCAALLSAQEDWYIDKPIADFTFIGLDTVSELELRPIVEPYKGTPFSLASFWEIQDKLYALDYFESIEASAKPGDEQQGSVIVEFTVKEKPTVGEVLLQGNRRLRRNEILERVLIKTGDMVTQTQAELDAQAIADLYLEKGYTDATVSARLEPGEEENTVNLKFTIVEGVQTAIKSISFSGNSFASESTLRRQMKKTRVQSLFSPGLFQEARFEEDLRSLVEYYTGKGYIDARVENVDRKLEKDETEGKNYLYITIYINEGQQWNYGGMSIEGNHIFSTEELQALVRQKPGSVLSKTRLEADTQRVLDLYFENGYIFNVMNRTERRDEKTREIFYVIQITENDRAHIENIMVKGNEKTKDYVIYRELPVQEGDVFSKAKVLQGLQNLYNLQYFTSIQPETPQGSAEGLMDLVINVEEGSTANINFGVTFGGGTYPISGLLKWEENNFLGRGQKLGVNAELSTLRQLISLSFEEPWLFGKRWLGGVSLSLEHAQVPNVMQDMLYPDNGDEDDAAPDPYPNYDAWQAAIADGETIPEQYLMDYTLWNLSLGFSMGYRHFTPLGWLGFRSGISTNLERVSYDADLYRPFDSALRDSNQEWKNVNKLGVTLFWDRRDFYLNPTKGTYLAQGATFAVGFPLGSRQYIRTDSTAEGFLTLFNVPVSDQWNLRMVLAAHSALSFILPEDAVAITNDLLYVDGWNVARGWPLETEKRVLWDNRLELRLPIAQQLLWWTFFLDGVTAYEQVRDFGRMGLDDFYFSVGGGLRFTIPQFPIRLYLAKRFQWDEADHTFRGVEGDLPFFKTTIDFVISLGGDVF